MSGSINPPLRPATTTALGGVIAGAGLNVAGDGTLSVSRGAALQSTFIGTVNLSVANTFFAITTLAVPAGTYLISASAHAVPPQQTEMDLTITDGPGTTTYVSNATTAIASADPVQLVIPAFLVTLPAPTTLTLRARAVAGTIGNIQGSSTGQASTYLTAQPQ